MKFVLIFGPQAVGKMTVAQELGKITGLKVFHNHMSIDLVLQFFEYGSESFRRLNGLFRQEIFEEVAKSDMKGLIFTYVWAFDQQNDWDYAEHVCMIFEDKGADLYFVELEADITERLERNKSPHRLEEKPSKRNVEFSEKNLLNTMKNHRLNSEPGEITKENYIRINNTKLNPEEVAEIIKDTFKL